MTMRTIFAAATLLALVACNAPAGNNSAAANDVAPGNEAATNSATPAPVGNETAAAPAGSATLSRDYIVGRWTDTTDCADAMDFRADGTLHAPTPLGEAGRWELNGDRLVNVGNPNELTIRVIDQNTMETTNSAGRTTRVTRCQG